MCRRPREDQDDTAYLQKPFTSQELLRQGETGADGSGATPVD